MLQGRPAKAVKHCCDAGSAVVVMEDKSSCSTLHILKLVIVLRGVWIPHCAGILHCGSDKSHTVQAYSTMGLTRVLKTVSFNLVALICKLLLRKPGVLLALEQKLFISLPHFRSCWLVTEMFGCGDSCQCLIVQLTVVVERLSYFLIFFYWEAGKFSQVEDCIAQLFWVYVINLAVILILALAVDPFA